MTSFYGSVNGGQGGSGEGIDTSTLMQKNNPTFNGTITGPNARFTGTVQIPEPTEDNHAATKGYVDAALADVDLSEVTTRMDAIETAQDELAAQLDDKVDAENPAFTGTATLDGKNIATVDQIPNISDLPYLDENNPTYTGTLTGENAAFSGTVTVATPAAEGEAANKGYVDAAKTELKGDINTLQQTVANQDDTINTLNQQVTNITGGTAELPYLKNTGDSGTGVYDFTGATVNAAEPVDNSNVATKHYVDQKIASAGGTGEVVSYTQGDGISISPENEISLSIDSAGANGLKVGANGLGLDLATGTTSGAMAASDKLAIASNTTEITNIKDGTTELPYLKETNPTYEGTLIGGDATFTGSVQISTPDQDNEAANKSYVDTTLVEAKSYTDSEITDLENGTTKLPYVKKSGDTMTGSLTIGTTTINEFGVVQTDKIANTGIMGNGYGIDFSGDPKITNFNTNDFVTLSVGEPTSNGHAATKKYVDDKTQIIVQSVETETERATEAETALQTAIDTEITDRKASDAATNESIQSINQDIDNIKNDYLPLNGSLGMEGDLNANSHSITNLMPPVNGGDASNKQYTDAMDTNTLSDAKSYADTKAEQVVSEARTYTDAKVAEYLPLEGGVMTGVVSMGNNRIEGVPTPIDDSHVVNKKYVDDKAGNYLPLAGGTMTGSIDAGENTITNLKEPEEGTDATTKNYVDGKIAQTAPVPPEVSGKNLIQIKDSVAYRPLQGLKIFGKSTQVSNQLLPLTEETYMTGGLTATLQGDGSLVVNGTPQSVPVNLVFLALNLEPGTYYVSGGVPTSSNLYLCVQTVSPSGGGFYVNQSFTITGNETSVTAMIQNVDTTPLNNYAISPMLNRGNSALPIQKYAMPTPESPIPITSAGGGGSIPVTFSDGGSKSQSLTISTPNGLSGIPVDSGGNYTDVSGQQWVCDVKDYGTGKYTQMVGHIESYNSENITTPYMSTTGQLSTDAEVYYVLDEPVITDISADELTAYRALHTYDGTTIISTDEDISGLKVKYVAKAIDYQQSINAAIQKTNDKIDAVYNSLVKKAESVDEVNQLFKDWWNANWEDGSSTYNDMLERWFGKVLDDDKVYGVKLPLFETSTSPQGEYIEDCIGAIVLPATEEDPGQNDFAKTPQFWCVEVAAEKNADGSHTIYACEYIDDIGVVRNGGPDNGKHLVWVLQKNTYVRQYEESGYSYIKIQCHSAEGFVQWPQGTDRTGHTYSYIANPKYAAGIDEEGNIGCRTGLKPTSYMSMNQTIQAWRARGSQYSGSSACFYKWAYIMFALLTAKKGEELGCNNYNYQYAAAVSESGVSRIILPADQANNLYVGSNVIVGNTEGNNDRDQAAMYSLVNQKRISSIEEVTIEEDTSSYKAVYIDVPEGTTFNTTAGTTYISTMPYYSGWTDTVKGTIGTKYGTNLNKQPYSLQKVELMNGAYNYVSDELDQWNQQDDTHYLYSYYLCEDQTKVSINGTITDDYIKKENATITIDTSVYTTNDSWYYVEDNLADNNFKMLNPKKISTSAGSGTGTRDAFYLSYAASGVRTPIALASLQDGGLAGLSCRDSGSGPSQTSWYLAGGCPGLSG